MIVDNAQAVKFISEPFAFTQHTLYMLLLFVKHKVRCYAMSSLANVVQNDLWPLHSPRLLSREITRQLSWLQCCADDRMES